MADSDLTPPRRRLPDVALPPLAGGDAVPLRARRQGTVLVLLDETADDAATDYLRRLAEAEPALRGWDGRVLVVVAGTTMPPALAALVLPFPVLADPGRVTGVAAGVEPPAVVVGDQWGEIHATQQ